MRCPFCSKLESKVVDSRPSEDGRSIRRRRECCACRRRFTTYESVENMPMMVRKRDGSFQAFDPKKILTGLLHACEKRPITLAVLENMVTDIRQVLQNRLDGEITTAQIGDMILERLKKLDEVAYIRFASVYRHFDDVDSFLEELNQLLAEQGKPRIVTAARTIESAPDREFGGGSDITHLGEEEFS